MNEKILVIVNPVSANGKTGKTWPIYESYFLKQGLSLNVKYTSRPNHAISLVREGVNKGYKKIMAVGGDGTINEVVNGLIEGGNPINPDVKLIVFSQGTGSDYIKSIGISNNPEDIVKIIRGNRVKYFDIGLITYVTHKGNKETRYFINIADAGIGAETAFRVNQGSKKYGGFISYLNGAIKTIAQYNNKMIKIVMDKDRVFSGRLNSVIVANGEFFGGGMKIAPGSDLTDGLFNVVILGNLSKFEIFSNLIKAYKGEHLTHPKIQVLQGKEVVIESEERVLIEIDGESLGRLPAQFKIFERRLPVLVL